jgi:hypothetical protein
MIVVKSLFMSACFVCIAIVAWNGRWEGQLLESNSTWAVDLGRSPIWSPPPTPSFERFQKAFGSHRDFAGAFNPNYKIHRNLKLDWMVVDLLVYLWPATMFSGLCHLIGGKKHRDFVLYLGFTACIGLTTAFVSCFGLWLMVGGWGAPSPALFGSLGLILGLIAGQSTFDRGRSNDQAIEQARPI